MEIPTIGHADGPRMNRDMSRVFPGKGESSKPQQTSGYLQFVGLLVVILCTFTVGYYAGKIWGGSDTGLNGSSSYVITGSRYPSTGTADAEELDFDLFWEVWNTIKSSYVDPGAFTEKDLFYGAIQGLAAGVGDQVTVYLDPEQTGQYNEGNEGKFEGIGAELGYEDGVIIVVAPLEGSPAAEAGLRSGDRILAVDGVSTAGQNVFQVVAEIRGDAGTAVKLTISRGNDVGTMDVEVTRGEILVPSITYEGITDGIALVDVDRFTEASATAWQLAWDSVVEQVAADDPEAVILDLRGNPGGYFNAAIWAAGDFLPNGTLVSQQTDRNGNDIDFTVMRDGALLTVPLVVLVNEGSASASEILAGALQHYGRAYIIGEKTYGKGTAQQVIEYSDGSSLHITTLKWLLPSGAALDHEHVIEPDLVVELTDADFLNGEDPQLDAAHTYLKSVDK